MPHREPNTIQPAPRSDADKLHDMLYKSCPPLTPISYNPSHTHTHTRQPFKHFFLSISYFVRPHPTPPDPAPSTIQQPPTHPPHPPHPFFFRSSITHANRDRLTSPHTCHTVNPTRYSRHLEAMQTSCMTCCTSRAPSHTNPIQSITHTHTRPSTLQTLFSFHFIFCATSPYTP